MSDTLIKMNNIAKLRAELKYIWLFLMFLWVLLLLEWVIEFGYIKNRLEKVESKIESLTSVYHVHKHKIITGEVYDKTKKNIKFRLR